MNDLTYVTRRYSSYNHFAHVISSQRTVSVDGVHELLRLVEDAIILIIDIEVQDVVFHNVINELTFFLWINSFFTFVNDRSRRLLLLHHPGGADLLLLLDVPLLDGVV